jgi:cytochrome c-type biogenesis protein CcmH/NrfG
MRAYYPAKALYLKGMFYAEQGQIKFAREAYESYLEAASPLDPYRAEVEQRLVELQKFEAR